MMSSGSSADDPPPSQVPRDAVPAVQAMAAQQQADALLGYGAGEPDLFIKAAPMEAPADSTAADAAWGAGQWCLSDRGAMNLLGLLLTLPSGVLQPSLTIPGKSAWRVLIAGMDLHASMPSCFHLRHPTWLHGCTLCKPIVHCVPLSKLAAALTPQSA